MPQTSLSKVDSRYLVLLRRSRKKAIIALAGCFLTVICLLLTATALRRTYGRNQLPQGFDLLGTLLGASAFITIVGGGVSAWLVIDTATEYKRIKRIDDPVPPEFRL